MWLLRLRAVQKCVCAGDGAQSFNIVCIFVCKVKKKETLCCVVERKTVQKQR